MITVFERIPELFVERYDALFRQWARDYRKLGSRIVVRLARPLEPSVLSTERRRIVGVQLVAQLDGKRMLVRPADEANEDAIRRHVAELRRGGLN